MAATAVVATAGVGIAVQHERDSLVVAEPYQMASPEPFPLVDASPQQIDVEALRASLSKQAAHEDVGRLHVRVSNGVTGETIFDQDSTSPLRPASATKLLTAAAATLTLERDDVVNTEVVVDGEAATIIARGDVWLTPEKLDELAAQVRDHGSVNAVYVDTSAWQEPTMMPGWDPEDIDAGYIAPMEPVMVYGARLGGATHGDEPRSHTPALDVGRALAVRLGVDPKSVELRDAPTGARVVGTVESPPLHERLREMMKDSDNVMAEAIGREIARARQHDGKGATAPQATLDVLREAGFDLSGVTLKDSCGLSTEDLIPPKLLDDVLLRATQSEDLRPVLDTLAVAGGDGTLVKRYGDLPGKGWVRAKTGTLTGTSALVGTVTSRAGNVYTFAAISNDSDIETARAALDRFASTLRDF
ncbi:D-alanyl-D-alanine carboxypeptidase/D-alanyl-D-alanine-endopeptidase [Corynebacterium aquatimens]